LVLVLLAGTAVGVAAYHAGQANGLEQSGRAVQVVRDYGPGFFPFGFFLFPLVFFGIFLLIGGAFRRRAWGSHGPHHHDHGTWRGPEAFEEWHRRQHDQAGGPHAGGDVAHTSV
jgi:hypothetical protein